MGVFSKFKGVEALSATELQIAKIVLKAYLTDDKALATLRKVKVPRIGQDCLGAKKLKGNTELECDGPLPQQARLTFDALLVDINNRIGD